MDSGYVATRPRFTRARHTWKANVRNLTIEDVRALRTFRDITVLRGSLPFYYPNLIPNWSFEFPAVNGNEVVQGWVPILMNGISIAVSSASAADGSNSIQFATQAKSLAAGAILGSKLAAAVKRIPVPGEVYAGVFQWKAVVSGGLLSDSFLCSSTLLLILEMSDGSQVEVDASANNSFTNASLPPSTFTFVSQTFTIPTPTAGLSIVGAQLLVYVGLQNTGTGSISIAANNIVVNFDAVGLALSSTPNPIAQMIGSNPIVAPDGLRFPSGGLPQFSDMGWAGQTRYGVTFQLEEV